MPEISQEQKTFDAIQEAIALLDMVRMGKKLNPDEVNYNLKQLREARLHLMRQGNIRI